MVSSILALVVWLILTALLLLDNHHNLVLIAHNIICRWEGGEGLLNKILVLFLDPKANRSDCREIIFC